MREFVNVSENIFDSSINQLKILFMNNIQIVIEIFALIYRVYEINHESSLKIDSFHQSAFFGQKHVYNVLIIQKKIILKLYLTKIF
jgi:hypothetical protein